jgi:hypothetical protein
MIAIAVTGAICAFIAVALIREMRAALARVEDQISRKRAEMRAPFARTEDQIAQGLGEMKADISRVQRVLRVRDFPFPRRRRAD